MLKSRNDVWPCEYMTFSRRIGELWEPFCKLCFTFPINKVSLFLPPLFTTVKQKLTTEIEDYLDKEREINKVTILGTYIFDQTIIFFVRIALPI
jgi:hypothetical protein